MNQIQKNRKEIKEAIHGNLPYGCLTKIANKINSKGINKVSISYVRNVLNPNSNAWHAEVISEAQSIIIEQQEEILRLNKPIIK
jgi:hypothetical protein